jgi:hypothetical protein
MGSLYIANVSRQRQVIFYRLETNRKGEVDDRLRLRAATQQVIESGKQAPVGGDLHPNQMSEIIEQLTTYGMVGVVDVPNQLQGVVPLIFNIDAPVPRHIMMKVVQHNSGAKVEEGALRRERAAIATNEALKNNVDNVPQAFDVEFEQEEVSEMDEKSIAQGFHVVEKPEEGPKPGKRKAA